MGVFIGELVNLFETTCLVIGMGAAITFVGGMAMRQGANFQVGIASLVAFCLLGLMKFFAARSGLSAEVVSLLSQ